MRTPRAEDRPRPGRVRARLADVAAAAGTSKPIASRILNGDPTLSVGAELRARVLAAASELGYRPHAGARALRRSQTGALGMLVPPLANPLYIQLVRGAFRQAAMRNFTVLLAEDFEEQESSEIFARLVLEGRIDGLIVASTRPGHLLVRLLAERPVPHVFVNRALPGSGRNVVMDDARSIELALEHLVGLGHRRIAHVAGPLGIEPVARRAEAFRSHAARLGLQDALIVEQGLLEADGAEGLRSVLSRSPSTTALLLSTVSQAVGALSEAWKLGIAVPDELSIVAHADMPLAEFLVPPLTAVRMPLRELGAASVDALLEQIETGATRDVVVDVEPMLVLRDSTAPPVERPARIVVRSAGRAR